MDFLRVFVHVKQSTQRNQKAKNKKKKLLKVLNLKQNYHDVAHTLWTVAEVSRARSRQKRTKRQLILYTRECGKMYYLLEKF